VRINNLRFDSAELYARTTGAIQRALEQYSSQINLQKKLLYGLDPSAILSRGYSIVRLNGTVIKSAEEYKAGDELMIQLHQGQITIKDSKNEEEQQSRIEF
jgi:exonuclease VII large subunit